MMSIDPTQKRQRPTLLHPLLPRFTVSKLERRYRDDRLGYRLTALRVSFVAGIALTALYLLLGHRLFVWTERRVRVTATLSSY